MRVAWTCAQEVARAGELQAATRQVLEESTRTVKEKLHTKGRHRKQAQLHLRVRARSLPFPKHNDVRFWALSLVAATFRYCKPSICPYA